MSIPTRAQCFALMAREAMPLHIGQHSVQVARVATGLARELVRVDVALDVVLVERASLLHDIGKARSLRTREDHGVLGADILDAEGYGALSQIVRAHVGLWSFEPQMPIDESLVVNYSDKRVKHCELVALSTRFEDLGQRYARTEQMVELLAVMRERYRLLEESIFALLSFAPDRIDAHIAGDIELPDALLDEREGS